MQEMHEIIVETDPCAMEVRLTNETIKYLREQMRDAVEEAMKSAMNEDTARAFWGAGLKVLQEQAAEHAGRFVLGGLWGLVRKLSTFLLLGGIVYAVGGWQALVGLFKVLFSSGGH
jgi:hypothetical protein